MGEFKFRSVRVIQLTAAVLLFLIIIFYPGPWNATRLVGLVIAMPSLVLLFIARFQLGQSFSVSPQAKQLVTTGLYSKIRNPMYVFSFLLVLGLVIALQKPYFYVVLLIILPIQVLRAHQEARVLEQKFGDAYLQYRRKTWF